MDELINKLKEHIHWAVFLLLELFSGLLLFQFNNYQGSVWFTQANVVAGNILEVERNIISFIHLKEQNQLLTRQNQTLQYNLNVMRQQLEVLSKDSSYTERMHAASLVGERLIPAEVVSNSVLKKDNFLIINKGSNDGVKAEMGVVSGTGIVGIVSEVTSSYALVMSVLNSKSNISCRLRGTNYLGYLKWRGGNPLQVQVVDVPHHARCKGGDVVETSGYSNVFPQGIFIGRVAQIHDSADGLAFQLEVQLSTDLACVQSVCVVAERNKSEIDSLTVQP